LNLPVGLAVSVEALTARERGRLARLPTGFVEWRGSEAVRRAVPVVEVALAVVFARSEPAGLVSASRFASYCRRLMVLPEPPVDEAATAMRASFYGVGIAVASSGGQTVLVPPEPVTDRRVTAAGWWFTESVYRQIRPVEWAAGATPEVRPTR
jgi:hypothetical protein